MTLEILVNTGSGNGLLPDGTKSLPEPMFFHCLNQCWFIISKVLWHSSEDIIIGRFEDTNQQSKIEDYIFKITLSSPRSQWVKPILVQVLAGAVREQAIIIYMSQCWDPALCHHLASLDNSELIPLNKNKSQIWRQLYAFYKWAQIMR